ncbi:hypothetical protein DVH24_021446 [Malus domestica]|uniref:Reverse transcriptase zinc-binding domain-containing protein n=1 Tax=Malus domestica TaxID=3750 RepID=A0A498K158_MALDO|nr:hypothetical protein DVH24_021446 [Malus domestica]
MFPPKSRLGCGGSTRTSSPPKQIWFVNKALTRLVPCALAYRNLHCTFYVTVASPHAHRNNINSIEDWVLFLASHLSQSHFEICLMIFWAIWCARNDQLWKGGSKRQDIVTLRAISWWLNFQKAQSHPSISRPLIPSMSWKKPHPGYVNINVDRAWKESEKCGGVGLG